MARRFREHDLRHVTSLDGMWDFAFLGDRDADEVDVSRIAFRERMAVPASYDATPAYAGRRGLVAYRTRILIRDDLMHRLVFEGVNHWCRVYVDGEWVRDHAGGFTRFEVDIMGKQPGEVDVVVLVDNRFDYERCPLHMEYFDWYHYGGITRSVALHYLGAFWIDAMRVITEDIGVRRLRVGIDYRAAVPPGQVDLMVTCDGHFVLSERIEPEGMAGTIERVIELPDAKLWSPSEPNLHQLHMQLGEDDLRERVGIREIALMGRQILINEEPVRLLGFNRHEAHPQFGSALPDSLLVADVQQLRDLNANFVRGSHYPQDTRFLDLCDEMGICVWNEAIGWQHTASHLTDLHFIEAQEAHIDEMVAASFNHPSVIMWGILNESHSHDAQCRTAYRMLLGRLHGLDPSRPLTYASNHPFDDMCFDLADVISVNTYPGWYAGSIEDVPERIDEIVAHLEKSMHGEKPLIISEIGAGAIPGWRDWNEGQWTEQYQAKVLDSVIRYMFLERERFAGLAIWQFCDCRTSELTAKAIRRPRGFNNKGVVDEYRRPKMAYEVVKRHFRSLNEVRHPGRSVVPPVREEANPGEREA